MTLAPVLKGVDAELRPRPTCFHHPADTPTETSAVHLRDLETRANTSREPIKTQLPIMAHFESLPVEVMGDILEVLDSPADLAATIHASPFALSALRSQRRRIMSSIIHKALPGEVIKEAERLLNCPVFEQDDGDLTYGVPNRPILDDDSFSTWDGETRWAQKVRDFAYWYFSSGPVDPEFPRDTAHLVAIYRIWRVLNTFVPDLARHTEYLLLPKEQQLGFSESEVPCYSPLTSHESIRIQIAFLRHELMCQLHGLPYSQPSSSQRWNVLGADQDVWTSFLGRFSALSLEELRHIGDYVRLKYNLTLGEIREDATALLKRGQEQISRHASLPAAGNAGTLLLRDGPRFLNRENGHLDERIALVKARRRVLNYIGNLTKLGLGFTHAFLKSGRPARRRFITETFETILQPHEGDPVPAAAFAFMERELDDVQRKRLNREEAGGWRDERSVAWTARRNWGGRLCLEHIDGSISRIDELRKLSWTFWDLDRLKKLGIVEDHSTGDHVRLTGGLQIQEACESQTQSSWILDLDVLHGEVSKQMWEDEFTPEFCTGPEVGKADSHEEYRELLGRILQQAEEYQIGKVTPWVD